MQFKHYDSLRVFTYVARYGSFSAAAHPLNRTKGAISHQIRLLETSLGFALFHRQPRGILLTSKGEKLLSTCLGSFTTIEDAIENLRGSDTCQLTIGVTTYFASRWLSQKLMKFMQHKPDVRLRLQPMIDLSDLDGEGIDLAIRWGNGNWKAPNSQLLFSCPAWPCGNQYALEQVQHIGLEEAFRQFTLLHDRQDSNAWKQWFTLAGLSYPGRADTLIIPDPNVRVESVINDQGVALADVLVERELNDKRIYRLSNVELSNYGYYLVYSSAALSNPVAEEFSQWMFSVV